MNEIPQETDYSVYLANKMQKVLDFTDSYNSSNNGDIPTLIVIQSFIQNITKSLSVNLDSSKFILNFGLLLLHKLHLNRNNISDERSHILYVNSRQRYQ